MCKRTRNRMLSRVKKEKILNGIKILTYWSAVSGIIYIHAFNNMLAYRKHNKM